MSYVGMLLLVNHSSRNRLLQVTLRAIKAKPSGLKGPQLTEFLIASKSVHLTGAVDPRPPDSDS